MNTEPEPKPFHIRVTRLHATGGHNSRDVDLRDRESWKRIIRGAKETLEQGGEHHMRPLYMDDVPATSAPAPLKLRVEELEKGLSDMLAILEGPECRMSDWWDSEAVERARLLLAKKPGTKKAGE